MGYTTRHVVTLWWTVEGLTPPRPEGCSPHDWLVSRDLNLQPGLSRLVNTLFTPLRIKFQKSLFCFCGWSASLNAAWSSLLNKTRETSVMKRNKRLLQFHLCKTFWFQSKRGRSWNVSPQVLSPPFSSRWKKKKLIYCLHGTAFIYRNVVWIYSRSSETMRRRHLLSRPYTNTVHLQSSPVQFCYRAVVRIR